MVIRDSCVTDRIIKTMSTAVLICALDTSFSILCVCVLCVLVHFISLRQLRCYPCPSICLEMCISQRQRYINHVSTYILHCNNAFFYPNSPSACSSKCYGISQMNKHINTVCCMTDFLHTQIHIFAQGLGQG